MYHFESKASIFLFWPTISFYIALALFTCLLRKDVWATFPRQEEAMKFAKAHKDVHVFSYQDHFSGQRRFLVSTYKEFWKRFLHHAVLLIMCELNYQMIVFFLKKLLLLIQVQKYEPKISPPLWSDTRGKKYP